MDDYERIKRIITYFQTTKNKLGKEIGYKNGVIFYHIASGRNGISADLAKKIVKLKPEVNYEWLLEGRGEMLKKESGTKEDKVSQVESLIKRLETCVEILEKKTKDLTTP